jgi:CheY-like chemotaxis protein
VPRAANVLIVDDDKDHRSALGEVLESEGCTVYTAENGRDALSILDVLHPDLLLVDLMMPVMDGWELCAELERTPRLADIPVVILSAAASVQRVGGRRVLAKPVGLSTVIALLDIIERP